VRDLDDICGIEDASFSDPYPPALMRRLLQDHPSSFFVATVSNRIIGYCVASFNLESAHLVSIAVIYGHRRKGVATALLSRLLELLKRRGMRKLLLEVKLGNEAAIGVYKKLGFSKVNVIRNYYADGSAAVKMQLDLGD
jgi:ribosomal-protein-alanine N-acetyltransferase